VEAVASVLFLICCAAVLLDMHRRSNGASGEFRLIDSDRTAWWVNALLSLAFIAQGLVWLEDRRWWRAVLLVLMPLPALVMARAAYRQRQRSHSKGQ
jgi:hypothetical protein